MTYYETLLAKRGLKLTDEQISIRNAWFVSQNDQTRRFKPLKPLAQQERDVAEVHEQADQQELTRQVRRLFH